MKIVDKLISVNHGGRRARTDGVVLHSTGSRSATSQFGWFSNPKAQASSHVHVADDGTVERYVPDDLIAWANGAGNARLLSIETQGDGTEPWTPEQVESIAQVVAAWSAKFGFPLQLMSSSKPTEKGIGWHRLGVPPSKWVSGLGWLLPGGEKWSGAVGKVCPGDKRIAQVPQILARAQAINGTAPAQTPVKPKPAAKPKPAKGTVYTIGSSGSKVKNLQKALNRVFPSYSKLVVDGIYGARTAAVVREFQKRAGLVDDGVCGPLTIAALKKYGVTF